MIKLLRKRISGTVTLASLLTGLQGASVLAHTNQLYKVDIDNPVESVVTQKPDGSIEVVAGGNDTWGHTESFSFLYQRVTGDLAVRVQVTNLDFDNAAEQDHGNPGFKAGISSGGDNNE